MTVRGELGRTTITLALAAPGLGVGLRLTEGWESEWLAVQVVGLCAVVTVVGAHLGWRLVNRLRRQQPPAPPRMIPVVLRDEAGLVTPLHSSGGLMVALAAVTMWFVAATIAVRSGALEPDRVLVLAPVAGLAASKVVDLLGYRLGPRLALFPDRVEIRRGPGRYLIPWPAIVSVGVQDGRAVVFLHRANATTRRCWIPRHPAYGVPVGDAGMPAEAVVDTVERCRHDPAALRAVGP